MADIKVFDSKECTWKDMQLLIDGVPVAKLRGLKYKAKVEMEALHAAGDKPISLQEGNRTFEGSIKLLKGALDTLNRAAVLAGGNDILDAELTLVAHYKGQGSRLIQIDTLVGVRVTEYEKGWEQGAKNMDCELPIMFLDLISV